MTRQTIRGPGAVAAACTALFAVLAVAVTLRWAPLMRLDDLGIHAAHDPTGRAYRSLLRDWGAAVAPGGLLLAGLALAVLLLLRRRVRQGLVTAAASVGGNALAEGLKTAFGRARPDLHHTLARSTGYSFPSHHAVMAALVAGLVVLALLSELRSPARWVRPAAVAAAAVPVAFTAYSRVALGVHFPSDVLAGCALGSALVAVAAQAAGAEARGRVARAV